MGQKQFYVVFNGRRPGIYRNWKSCLWQVFGFLRSCYRGFETLQDAHAAYLAYREEDERNHRTPLAVDNTDVPQTSYCGSISDESNTPKIGGNVTEAFALGCLIGALAAIGVKEKGDPGPGTKNE